MTRPVRGFRVVAIVIVVISLLAGCSNDPSEGEGRAKSGTEPPSERFTTPSGRWQHIADGAIGATEWELLSATASDPEKRCLAWRMMSADSDVQRQIDEEAALYRQHDGLPFACGSSMKERSMFTSVPLLRVRAPQSREWLIAGVVSDRATALDLETADGTTISAVIDGGVFSVVVPEAGDPTVRVVLAEGETRTCDVGAALFDHTVFVTC